MFYVCLLFIVLLCVIMFSQDVCNDSLVCSFVVESVKTVEKGKV